ncbi:MAG: EutN/CcmL family microcompartment protein [Candidatus Eisenbacteria bacterium]
MEEARVLGTVVATAAVESLSGKKLVWIEPLGEDGRPNGARVVAVDTTQSGPGSLVFFVRSREAAEALDDPFTPADAAVVGIIDRSVRGIAR